MSAWSLARDLAPVADDPGSSEEVRRLARLAGKSYEYPVDVQVFSPDGELLARRSAHDLSFTGEDPVAAYGALLDRASGR